MSIKQSPIGLFDSGLGGLTVLRALRRALPFEDLLYLGDTARTPYGSKTPDTIRRYAAECAEFLLRKEIKMLIVACNTVTACCLEEIEESLSIPVLGTISPVVELLEMLNSSKPIAVVGTQATIASGAYERAIKLAIPESEIISVPCPLFVPLVENGHYSGDIVERVVAHYLEPVRRRSPGALILGCTHYPLLRDVLSDFFGPETIIVETSEAIAGVSRDVLESKDLLTQSRDPGRERYIVTDDSSRFSNLASLFLNQANISAIQIESLTA